MDVDVWMWMDTRFFAFILTPYSSKADSPSLLLKSIDVEQRIDPHYSRKANNIPTEFT